MWELAVQRQSSYTLYHPFISKTIACNDQHWVMGMFGLSILFLVYHSTFAHFNFCP